MAPWYSGRRSTRAIYGRDVPSGAFCQVTSGPEIDPRLHEGGCGCGPCRHDRRSERPEVNGLTARIKAS